MVAQIDKQYRQIGASRVLPRMISYLFFEGRPLTTKGRWINPLVFAIYAIVKKLPYLKDVRKPIYIVGTGRSGTTILGVILSMHRSVGFLNEPKALWHAAYPFEDLIGSYTDNHAIYRMDETCIKCDTKDNFKKMYAAYLKMTCTDRVVDKYPEVIFRTRFVTRIFPDSRFLFLARNGWDTCVSIDLWSRRLGSSNRDEVHDWWGRDDRKWKYLVEQMVPEHSDLAPHLSYIKTLHNHLDRAVLEWIISMREGLRLLDEYPESVLKVEYEQMTAEPEIWLQKILQFCQLPIDDRFIQYGCNVLKSVPARKPFDMDEILIQPFHETQRKLGY